MRPGALSFIAAGGQDEGCGGGDSRKTKVGDTSLRIDSVLDQDVSLRRNYFVLK